MSDTSTHQTQPMAPILTSGQQAVLAALKSKETDEFPLSDWYLGALYALENPSQS